MDMQLWIAFSLAATVILVIPGPTIILVTSQALTHGPRSVMPLAAGVVLGDFTAMTFSLLGLGALLSTSATLFATLKWAGALYLIYLGIGRWRMGPGPAAARPAITAAPPASLFRGAWLVTALNPKSILFFVAFMPQFISPEHPLPTQIVLLGATFLLLAGINAALYALFAGKIGAALTGSRNRKWFNRTSGGALIGAGALTAALQGTS